MIQQAGEKGSDREDKESLHVVSKYLTFSKPCLCKRNMHLKIWSNWLKTSEWRPLFGRAQFQSRPVYW